MAKFKEELLKKFHEQQFCVGMPVKVQGKFLKSNTSNDADFWNNINIVAMNDDGTVSLRRTWYKESEWHGEVSVVDPKVVEIVPDDDKIGYDPFDERDTWRDHIRTTGLGFSGLVFRIEEMLKNGNVADVINGVDVKELNFDPYIIDSEGNHVSYQRDYCWTPEDERSFIDSMYKGMNLGTIIWREHSYKWLEKETAKGNKNVGFFDVIDGKQRIHTLVRFISDKFSDSNGMYWSDLSKYARRKMMTSMKSAQLTILSLEEEADDETTLQAFLAVNFYGKAMSKEHVDFVRGLYEKIRK